ncbi:MAG: hypothetical protein ACI8RZ_000205 [Myxococcota bacterium]|jgi:hypothetical protein
MVGGCAPGANELAFTADTGGDQVLSPDDFDTARLRIDVLPTVEVGDDLLAQSLWLDEQSGWQDLTLSLRPTVTITGTVTGFAANPYSITVPGAGDVPILSTVTLGQPGTIASSSVQTGEDGSFTLSLPAGDGYQLSVLPEELGLPMVVEEGLQVSGEADIGEIDLGYGDPIYGTVTTSDDETLSVTVRLIDAATGVVGFATQTDAAGFYTLRAAPGDYLVQIEPVTGTTMPTIQEPITLKEDIGVRVDIDVGIIEPVLVRGVPRTADGQTMSNAIVRLTADSLVDTRGTMVVETETDQSGGFLVYALPGEWSIEIIPPPDDTDLTAPLEQALTVEGSEVNLGNLKLTEQVVLERRVVDSSAQPAANVLVTFVEQGFNHATYTAYTDETGGFSLSVPDVPLNVWLTPTRGEAAVTRRELLNPSAPSSGDWALSDGVRLRGSVRRPDAGGGISIVEVYDEDGVFYGSTLTDAEGAFDFRITP